MCMDVSIYFYAKNLGGRVSGWSFGEVSILRVTPMRACARGRGWAHTPTPVNVEEGRYFHPCMGSNDKVSIS